MFIPGSRMTLVDSYSRFGQYMAAENDKINSTCAKSGARGGALQLLHEKIPWYVAPSSKIEVALECYKEDLERDAALMQKTIAREV